MNRPVGRQVLDCASFPSPTTSGRDSMNPNGIQTQSPGLRGTSYPGLARPEGSNPNGVASSLLMSWPQPRWGWRHVFDHSQGCSRARNPGLEDAIPLGLAQKQPGLVAKGKSPLALFGDRATCESGRGLPPSRTRARQRQHPDDWSFVACGGTGLVKELTQPAQVGTNGSLDAAFPLAPALSPRERESVGILLETSGIAGFDSALKQSKIASAPSHRRAGRAGSITDGSPALQISAERCSLSPWERAGVRGKVASKLPFVPT